MTQWNRVDHWAAAALQAVDTYTDAPGWITRIVVALPETAVRGGGANASKSVRRLLNGMRTDTGDDFLRWDDELAMVHVAAEPDPQAIKAVIDPRRGDVANAEAAAKVPPLVPAAALVLGGAHIEPVTRLLLGVRFTAPVEAVIAVQRGYIRTLSVKPDGHGGEVAEQVWLPGGPAFPNDLTDAQPAVAAFAVDRRTGDAALLAHRVHSTAVPLSREEEGQTISVNGIGVLSLLDLPSFALRAACGKPMDIPDLFRMHLPQPGWIVGRWWLHTLWQNLLVAIDDTHGRDAAQVAIETATIPADAADLAYPFSEALAATPAPPRDLAASWQAVVDDQVSSPRLGRLTTPAEAQHLPAELFAEWCVSATPAQGWLWRQIRGLLDHDATRDALRSAEQQWALWPELHEPEHFMGIGRSNRR